jgi:endonuclease-3
MMAAPMPAPNRKRVSTAAGLPAARRRVARILKALESSVGSAQVELTHDSPLELLMATILSAQCTDRRVNQVTPLLFKKYRSALDYAEAVPAELETMIRSTGFFKNKAKNLIACGRALADRYEGRVPDEMDALITLPGVGRKTANVILGGAFGKPGIVVDTHVKRVACRLGLSTREAPEKIEQDLQRLIPQDQWTAGSQRLLLHGRYVCVARIPRCEQCVTYDECEWKGKRSR